MATVRHDGTTRPIVRTDVLVPGGHRPEVIIANPEDIGGGGGGGGAVTIADGDDETQGAIADAAVTSDSDGTVSGKLRGLVTILADVWDAANDRLRTAIHDGGNSITVDDGGSSLTVDGTVDTTSADGAHAALGSTTDAEAAGDGTLIAIVKRIRTLLAGTLTVSISGTPTVNQGTSPWIVGDGGASLSVDDGGGVLSTDSADGAHATLGTTTDAEASGDGTVIALLKRLRTLFGGGLPAALSGSGNLKVAVLEGGGGATPEVDATNSTTANLANGVAFTGTSVDVTSYNEIVVTVQASHASAADGLEIQQSSDGTNWDIVETWTIRAGVMMVAKTSRKAQFFRLKYTNGGVTTTTLRIQTVLNVNPSTYAGETNGRVIIDGLSYEVKTQTISCTASGDTTVVASVTGRKIRVLTLLFTCAGNQAILFKSGSNTIVPLMEFATRGGPGVNFIPSYVMETNAGEALVFNLANGNDVTGILTYALPK